MPSPTQVVGHQAEGQAEAYLRKMGYVIIDRQVRSRFGEIDILAKEGKEIIAVEVRSRRNNNFGSALESIDGKKIERIEKTLLTIMEERGWLDMPYRIDILAIDGKIFRVYKNQAIG